MNKKRMLLFRLITVLILIAICAVMFVVGRGHTVYFDAKTAEVNGTEVKPPYKTEIYVNDERVAKLYDGERGMAKWMGQNFKMVVEITDEKGGESHSSAVKLKLPYNMDGIILNIPAMFAGAGQDVYLSEFIPAPEEVEEEEAPSGDGDMMEEFGIGEGETAAE
ncbi:MAG: hypothetical protein K5985_09325 [Lachnospiraceae bacterium]|nr:hypothetical protein [Lachnospiraceae bacterium]